MKKIVDRKAQRRSRLEKHAEQLCYALSRGHTGLSYFESHRLAMAAICAIKRTKEQYCGFVEVGEKVELSPSICVYGGLAGGQILTVGYKNFVTYPCHRYKLERACLASLFRKLSKEQSIYIKSKA